VIEWMFMQDRDSWSSKNLRLLSSLEDLNK